MFTREYLQSLATATVFRRGKDYFRSNSVGRITREGDKFTAKVHGSYPYKVQLLLRPGGAKLNCNCPYDFDGICKHAVALGLAVLKEFGPRLAASGVAAPAFGPAARRSTPADALRRDKALAQPATFTIGSVSTEVYKALSDLAFDRELVDDYDPDSADYRHEEETLHDAADEAIAAVLLPHAEAVGEALHAGRLAEALRRWVGVYEGSAAATEPAADEYELFGYDDYPAHVQGRWLELLAEQQLPQLLETKQFAAREVTTALALLAGRYNNGQQRAQPGTKKPGRVPAAPPAAGPSALAPPAHFHELLHALAHDPGAAAQLRPLLAAVPAPEASLAGVLLRVATVLADEPLWLRTSEAFAAHDAALATQLLDRYRASGDHASVRRMLGQLREKFPQPLNAYILRHLTLADDAALYLAALTQRCRNTHSLPDYQVLQAHWSPAQRRAFVDEQVALGTRTGNNPLFGAELLLAENRPAELLPYLRRLNWAWQRAVPEVLALAAPARPDDCLELVMERTETLLQDPTSGRTRDHYQRIVAWLTALHAVPELRPPVALFAAHLYTEYARLNALREELRAARLVRTQLVGKQHKLIVSEEEDEEVRALLRDKQPPRPGRKAKK
jgi:hypothetical protein